MKIYELRGNPQVFTQTDGKTFRIFPRKEKHIADNLISDEFRRAEKMKLILMVPDSTITPKSTETKQEVKN